MDPGNIEMKLSNGMLTIKSEKKDENEQREADYHLSERHYGSFLRSFQLPDGVDADKVEAHFENGVLTVKLPKTADSQRTDRKIAIKASGANLTLGTRREWQETTQSRTRRHGPLTHH